VFDDLTFEFINQRLLYGHPGSCLSDLLLSGTFHCQLIGSFRFRIHLFRANRFGYDRLYVIIIDCFSGIQRFEAFETFLLIFTVCFRSHHQCFRPFNLVGSGSILQFFQFLFAQIQSRFLGVHFQADGIDQQLGQRLPGTNKITFIDGKFINTSPDGTSNHAAFDRHHSPYEGLA